MSKKHQPKSGSRGKGHGKIVARRRASNGASVTEYEDGSRKIKMTPEGAATLKAHLEPQLEAFRKKFGREPGAGDPIFFDPDKDEPTPIPANKFEDGFDRMITNALARDAVRPEFAYAMFQTRRIVTTDNVELLSEAEQQEWTDAVDEYLELSTDRAKVFRIITVEGSKAKDVAGVERMMALAEKLGVSAQVSREFARVVGH